MIDLQFPEIYDRLRQTLGSDTEIYLVGGSVRDLLLGDRSHDLDFVLPGQAIWAARRMADALGGAFFPLDIERDTGRAIHTLPNGQKLVLDFATFRGPDLESDLRHRDLTINAMAIDLRNPERLIDPTGGAIDTRNRLLRAASPVAFADDPLRILRCVRLASQLEFRIETGTLRLMRLALPRMEQVSGERIRDEVFRILDGPRPVAGLRALEMLGALPQVLPDLAGLPGSLPPAAAVTSARQSLQSTTHHQEQTELGNGRHLDNEPAAPIEFPHSPYFLDAWEHTLGVVHQLHALLNILKPEHDPEAAANWAMGLVSLRIGRYRKELEEHLAERKNPDRSRRALLLMAALYNNLGAEATWKPDPAAAAEKARLQGSRFHLSTSEIQHVVMIIESARRPLDLARQSEEITNLEIYRFFHNAGGAGVEACLLALAEVLTFYGPGMPQSAWARCLAVVRQLLETWWEQSEIVDPPILLNGFTWMQELGVQPGPVLGRLLEAIREAQAAGEVQTREQALELARSIK